MREFKASPSANIKSESSGRTRTGIAAVFGNVDSTGDRIIPGSFVRTINNNAKRVQHLWNHQSHNPPIAKIIELREVTRKELPQEVLEKSPEATGGLLVKREYLKNPLSDWVLDAIDQGAIREMSFAFDTVRSETVKSKNDAGEDIQVRELQELALFDTSDVTWGANSATVTVGAKAAGFDLDFINPPAWVVANHLAMLAHQLKSGDTRSDPQLIDFIRKTAAGMGDEQPEEEKQDPNSNDNEQPANGEPAPAISDSTALLLKQNAAKLNELKLFLTKL